MGKLRTIINVLQFLCFDSCWLPRRARLPLTTYSRSNAFLLANFYNGDLLVARGLDGILNLASGPVEYDYVKSRMPFISENDEVTVIDVVISHELCPSVSQKKQALIVSL